MHKSHGTAVQINTLALRLHTAPMRVLWQLTLKSICFTPDEPVKPDRRPSVREGG